MLMSRFVAHEAMFSVPTASCGRCQLYVAAVCFFLFWAQFISIISLMSVIVVVDFSTTMSLCRLVMLHYCMHILNNLVKPLRVSEYLQFAWKLMAHLEVTFGQHSENVFQCSNFRVYACYHIDGHTDGVGASVRTVWVYTNLFHFMCLDGDWSI